MAKEVVVTREGYDKLVHDLDELRTVKRKEVADKIKVARGYGDLSENAEYDAAKEEQAVVEARIADLEATLKVARVIDDSEMLTCMHYVLVHPTHHGQSIAGKMVEYIKEKYKHYLYIELMPEERKNAVFYEKHGFRIMPDGAPMFLANYENKI